MREGDLGHLDDLTPLTARTVLYDVNLEGKTSFFWRTRLFALATYSDPRRFSSSGSWISVRNSAVFRVEERDGN